MAAIRSLIFFLLFYPGTLVYVLGVILFSPFGTPIVRRIVHAAQRLQQLGHFAGLAEGSDAHGVQGG